MTRSGAAFALVCLILSAVSAGGAEWTITEIPTDAPVTGIVTLGDGRVAVRDEHWKIAKRCASLVCLTVTRNRVPLPFEAPEGGLPDGKEAVASGLDVRRAWYAAPTERYGHGILGDRIEAGALVAATGRGERQRLDLAKTEVFEDLTPRLVDLDGDGRAEIVTIRAFLDRGASIAVYGLRQGRLRLVAGTPPIGRANRWLNVAGIADLTGDGRKDIAIVTTPHIGGTLEVWSFDKDRLGRVAARQGFSNHAIGSRNLALSAAADVNGDGRSDIVVPDDSRRSLRMMTVENGRLTEIGRVRLPGRLRENIGALPGPVFLTGLENGRLVAVSRPSPDE